MKKLKILLIIPIALISVYVLLSMFCYYTGALKLYNNTTNANEPNLELNSKLYISSWITPKNGDFVGYNFEDHISGKHTRIHRLIAKEYDTLQIINGNVYVNNQNIDNTLNLIHAYLISKDVYLNIKNSENIGDDHIAYSTDNDLVYTFLDKVIAKKYHLESARQISSINEMDHVIYDTYKNNWNKDNFGPLVIPKDQAFVLGDNRDNSEDSRYTGLIHSSNITGVLLNH